MSLLAQLANLRGLLHDMERDLGLTDLERKERDILLAFFASSKPDQRHGMIARTEAVRRHPTLHDISQPTFHRALRRLVDGGWLARTMDLPPGTYRLRMD